MIYNGLLKQQEEPMEAIRAFIAIEIPAGVRQQLDAVEKQIQTRAGEVARRAVRWVPVANMHLTLKFLGEVSTGNVHALARMLEAEANRYHPFEMIIGGLGAFPNMRRPQVIWVGTNVPPELSALQKAIEAETRQLGYPTEERPYSPHLTLGRITQSGRPEEIVQVAKALGEMQIGELARVQVERIHLFHSDLRPTGTIYTSLYDFPLRAAARSK
jgi:RNA 2',3'-cyclic 3'-phosphodiesterase